MILAILYSEIIKPNLEVIVVAVIGIATILSNYLLQRKNIKDQAKEKFYHEASKSIREASQALIVMAENYRQQADYIARIGDFYDDPTKKEEVSKLIDDRYNHLQKQILDQSYDARSAINNLFRIIENLPILNKTLGKCPKALRNEYSTLDIKLSEDFERMIGIGLKPTPNQFKTFGRDLISSKNFIYDFTYLLEDLEVYVHNSLVGQIYGERQVHKSGRKVILTKEGLLDPNL